MTCKLMLKSRQKKKGFLNKMKVGEWIPAT